MPLIQVAGPGQEPISVDEAKVYLRVIDSNDDDVIGYLITAARLYAEHYCERSFISQQWRLVLDSFPGPSLMGVPYGLPYSLPGHAVLLERGPVISVDSITYVDMGGVPQPMPSANYKADLSGPLPRVTPVFGQIWPITLPQIGSVQVNYTAGYGTKPSDVPAGIKHWLLMRLATLYENREEVAILGKGKVEILPFVDSLLDPYRVVRF